MKKSPNPYLGKKGKVQKSPRPEASLPPKGHPWGHDERKYVDGRGGQKKKKKSFQGQGIGGKRTEGPASALWLKRLVKYKDLHENWKKDPDSGCFQGKSGTGEDAGSFPSYSGFRVKKKGEDKEKGEKYYKNREKEKETPGKVRQGDLE